MSDDVRDRAIEVVQVPILETEVCEESWAVAGSIVDALRARPEVLRALAGVPDRDYLVPLAEVSRALDEIYVLRTLLAYEAAVRAADLELKSYPKSRREIAEHAIQRMRGAARGEEWLPYINERARRSARAAAGMPDTLTRASWLAERPDPTNQPEEGNR